MCIRDRQSSGKGCERIVGAGFGSTQAPLGIEIEIDAQAIGGEPQKQRGTYDGRGREPLTEAKGCLLYTSYVRPVYHSFPQRNRKKMPGHIKKWEKWPS